MFCESYYTSSIDRGQSLPPFDDLGDLASPLAIDHNGPLRSVSLFPGVVERDRREPSPKKTDPKEDDDSQQDKITRGRVIGLSRRSRLRLQVRINRCLFKAGRVWFLTLTYPREFPAHCVAKTDLRAFLKRVSRKWGKRGAIWRIENQKRGAPHFHIVLFLAAAVPDREFSEWSARAWHSVVGSGDENHLFYGTRSELFRSARGVSSYCSKYVSKPEEGERAQLIEGRQWGREGDFPEERVDFFFDEKDFFRFWRILRRSRGLVGHVGYGAGSPWKNLFCPALHDDWLKLCSFLGGVSTGVVEGANYYE